MSSEMQNIRGTGTQADSYLDVLSVQKIVVETKGIKGLELPLIVIFQIEHEKVTRKRKIHWEKCSIISLGSKSLYG